MRLGDLLSYKTRGDCELVGERWRYAGQLVIHFSNSVTVFEVTLGVGAIRTRFLICAFHEKIYEQAVSHKPRSLTRGFSPSTRHSSGSASAPLQPAQEPRQKPAHLTQQTDGEGRSAHLVELVEHRHRRRPVDTSICDAHTVLESRGPLGGDFLPPTVDVRLDHHAYDRAVARLELRADVVEHLGLVVVVLRRVAVCPRTRDRFSECKKTVSRRDVREQSTMIDGCESGRAFFAAAAAAFTNSDW